MIQFTLKELLKEKNMSITDLHQKTGISANTISLIANNKSNGIQFDTLEKIMLELDCSLDELIEYLPENDPVKDDSTDLPVNLNLKNLRKILKELQFDFKQLNREWLELATFKQIAEQKLTENQFEEILLEMYKRLEK